MDRRALVDGDVQPGGRAPAPAPLDRVQAFVNTVDREHGPDLFDDPAGLREWLARRDRPVPVSERDLAAAREVREALRALLWANNGRGPGDGAAEVLDRAAARAGLVPRFADGSLHPTAGGIDGVLGELLAIVQRAMVDGSWRRLKACPGRNCGWAFYDRSVNASATWCSMRVCGQRAKARAYYARTQTGVDGGRTVR